MFFLDFLFPPLLASGMVFFLALFTSSFSVITTGFCLSTEQSSTRQCATAGSDTEGFDNTWELWLQLRVAQHTLPSGKRFSVAPCIAAASQGLTLVAWQDHIWIHSDCTNVQKETEYTKGHRARWLGSIPFTRHRHRGGLRQRWSDSDGQGQAMEQIAKASPSKRVPIAHPANFRRISQELWGSENATNSRHVRHVKLRHSQTRLCFRSRCSKQVGYHSTVLLCPKMCESSGKDLDRIQTKQARRL